MGEASLQIPLEPASKNVGRLLLVDDEENILRSIKRVLRRDQWEIETAHSASHALEVFNAFAPAVVISDFRMPGMNGVDFLSRIKELAPRTQRIMLTGQADHQAIEEAINRSEVFRFISKPWNDQQLVLTVKSAFEQFTLQMDNDRLHRLTQAQNDQLRQLNADLEQRVTERTHLLSVAKREWEKSFDSIEQPLAIVERDYTVKRVNLAYARAAARPVRDVVQRPKCYEYLFGRSEACRGCPLARALESGQEGQGEVSHQGRTYVVSVYPMLEDEQSVCSYREVTEERQMTRRLVETEKMAAMGQLAGGVAHEINNPLGGILAFAQLMQRDSGRTHSDLESLSLIEESALRCKRIVESLLRFSRRSRVEDRRSFDLSRCIEDASVLFRAQLKSAPKAKLELKLASDLPEVFGDPSQLSQVVLNLLQNSLYAIGGEGVLAVETGRDSNRCYFRVRDNGGGISPEHLPHIFEPHFTTKPPGEGTGLGLAIAYRIVEDHGGSFEVETELGTGSSFTVFIPIPPSGLLREEQP